VCDTCGCSDDLEAQSKVELIKAASNRLRGDISAELNGPEAAFSDASIQLLKLHGSYQQEDRDRRKEARVVGRVVEVLAGEGHAAPSPALTALLSAV